MTRQILILTLALAISACSPAAPDVNDLAEDYLYLELSMSLHDGAHVDAYFGPEEIKTAAGESALSLDQILTASGDLASRLSTVDVGDDEMLGMRVAGLLARLQALDTRIAINKGDLPRFDDESLALFGSRAPTNEAAHFEEILRQIDALLPGDAPPPIFTGVAAPTLVPGAMAAI